MLGYADVVLWWHCAVGVLGCCVVVHCDVGVLGCCVVVHCAVGVLGCCDVGASLWWC